MVRRKNAELADLAETAAAEAERLLANAKRAIRKAEADAAEAEGAGQGDAAAGRRRGRLVRAVERPHRPAGRDPADRRADPAADGRHHTRRRHPPGQPARPRRPPDRERPAREAGRVRRQSPGLVDNADGIVLDHDVQPGNPADAPRLKPAVERVNKRTGRTPRTVAADRGYGEAAVDDDLHDLGVRNVVIPRKGRPTKARQAQRTTTNFPAEREMANRLRRPDQSPETQLRLGPHHDRHHRRSPDLDRTRSLRPQPHQDRHPDRLTGPAGTPPPEQPRASRPPESGRSDAGEFFRSK